MCSLPLSLMICAGYRDRPLSFYDFISMAMMPTTTTLIWLPGGGHRGPSRSLGVAERLAAAPRIIPLSNCDAMVRHQKVHSHWKLVILPAFRPQPCAPPNLCLPHSVRNGVSWS